MKQVFKFIIVGGLCFVIDYVSLYFLSNVMHYLVANLVAYSVSTIVNYTLSMKFVFESRGDSKMREICIFVFFSTLGLVLTEISMWLLTEKVQIYYMLSKIISTGIAMVFNFITRKLFIEKR